MLLSYLPDTIEKNGLTYKVFYKYILEDFSGIVLGGNLFFNDRKEQVKFAKDNKLKYLTIKVLSKNLRGKENLHGKPYEPITYVFVTDGKI